MAFTIMDVNIHSIAVYTLYVMLVLVPSLTTPDVRHLPSGHIAQTSRLVASKFFNGIHNYGCQYTLDCKNVDT